MKIGSKYLWGPFTVIGKNKRDLFIWFMFSIVAGQFGIIANIIIRYFSNSMPISVSIYLDSVSGNFYTYAIAFVTGSLSPFFIGFIKNSRSDFKSLKVILVIITMFFIIFSGLVYAAVQIKNFPQLSEDVDLVIDYPQFSVYFIALLIGLYSYCVLKMKVSEFEDLDDQSYDEKDDTIVDTLVENRNKAISDGFGMKL